MARLLAGGETRRAARPGRFQPLTPADVKAFEALLVGGGKRKSPQLKTPQLTSALEKSARAMLAAASAAVFAVIARRVRAQDVTLPIVSNKKFKGQTVIVESQSGPVISGPIQKLLPAKRPC